MKTDFCVIKNITESKHIIKTVKSNDGTEFQYAMNKKSSARNEVFDPIEVISYKGRMSL